MTKAQILASNEPRTVKMFEIVNSWGKNVGEGGHQWISEDYLATLILGYPVVWSVWTMVEAQDVFVVPVPPYVFTKTLKYGMTSTEVAHLQIKLNVKPISGYFGPITLLAVKDFQKTHGLTPDGIVGKLTNQALNLL